MAVPKTDDAQLKLIQRSSILKAEIRNRTKKLGAMTFQEAQPHQISSKVIPAHIRHSRFYNKRRKLAMLRISRICAFNR